MKSHDWIFLMFTTIICCTTIITLAQAQQRGRVKFGMSIEKDDGDKNTNPEIVNLSSQVRGSAQPRASSRFRAANPSAIPSTIEEIKDSPRPAAAQRGSRGRANDRSSRKLTAEATEAIPLVRSRKRISPVAIPSISVDQPIKVELPTSSVDRTNVIRRSKTRSEPLPSSTSPPVSIRRRSDTPSDGPTESIRKVRTFTSRSVTKQADDVISSEKPLTVATTGSSNWRNAGSKRGSAKSTKSGERKSKALEEDQLEDENYPEHFKLLLKKQQPSQDLLPKNYPKLPIKEDQTYSKINEIYEAPKSQPRPRRLEQISHETSDEILQVSRAIPKVRRVELKREDTARAALKSRRIEPRQEEVKSELKIEEPQKSRRTDAEKLRAQVKINKTGIKSRKKEPSNEVQREDIPKVPYKSNRRTESSTEDNNEPEVKPNEIEESTKGTKSLFLPRRAEPYRPKPKTTTQRPSTTSKPIKKPDILETRPKFKNRFNSRLQFPSLRTKTPSISDEILKLDNEVVHTSPAPPQPVRPLQITKSRNLAGDRPVVDTRPKPKQQKFSSRYRGDAFSRYQQKTEPSKPIYTPTIPALTTEPVPQVRQLEAVYPNNVENTDLNKSGSDFDGIVFDGTAGAWNMVEPVAGGLTRSEISVEDQQLLPQSSVTVSIFEALADILSKTPTTTTSTTTTTTTTTSTTELPDIIQVPEQNKIDSITSSTTVNTHDDVENPTTTTNEIIITNNDRDGRLLNSVEINSSTTIPISTLPFDPRDSSETITVPQSDTSDTTLLFKSQTEQTTSTPELTTLPTEPTLTNLNLTNISTRLLELTTLESNPPTSLPMPFLADALTTSGSSLITQPQLIAAISNFLDTSVQNASDTMATTTTENTTNTTATLDTNSTPTDASTTLSPPITTTFSVPTSTGSPPVTISFLDLFTIQAKKVNQNTEAAVDIHPIYKGPEATTMPVSVEKKQTTGRLVNINAFFGTQTYPSISVSGSYSTDRTIEYSSTFSGASEVTGGVTTDTAIPFTSTLEPDTSTLEYTTPSQSSSIRTQSLPIHLNSIIGSTQKYDQTSPFKTVQTDITTTIRSRFGNRRIPILPAGTVQSTTNKVSTDIQTSSTKTPISTSTTTTTIVIPVSSENNRQQLSKNITTTTSSTTEQKPIQDFSVYGILPNNTVVRKRPPQNSRQLDIGIMVYGILPNQTVVRKYPNGTLMIVDSSKDVEVIDIDPKMLFNPFSELYRTSQSSLLLTTHRSTTSTHRLIESNHILSSSSSSSTEVVPNNNINNCNNSSTLDGSGRRGNSIKDTTESGNTDSTLTTNTDDENLIQWLSDNEDNIYNSTILVESNTENAVLLDLLKRKYIKTDLPSRSSNVVSLTTARNIIEENSIPANKEEDVSENTLFDSSEEKKKDSREDLFLPNVGSVVPNQRFNNNNDDENVISKQFDTSYANVGIGSIFAGNKDGNTKYINKTISHTQ